MVQRLANASMDVDALNDDLKRHAAHAQKVVRDTFSNNSVALAERIKTCFQQEAAT